MCGILGVFDTNSSDKLEKTFNESLDLLKHRGPDDSGIKIFNISDGILVIGQTRLSIIDLSSAGHQPMQTEDNRYSIVFNGEIYNYKEIREELKVEGSSRPGHYRISARDGGGAVAGAQGSLETECLQTARHRASRLIFH